jgi:DNA-binding protein WhiA
VTGVDGDFQSATDMAAQELCTAPRDDHADPVELVTLVRFATGDDALIFGSKAAAQRVSALLAAQLRTAGRVTAMGPRARPRWQVRVADATGVRIRLGLLDTRRPGRRVQGLPPEVIARLDQDPAAIARAAFLAAGTIPLTGPLPRLQIACPTLAVALAVAGALRRAGTDARVHHHDRTGTDHVVVAGIDAVAAALAAIGAPRAAQRARVYWDDRRRRARPATRELIAANTGRAQQAATTQVALVRAALAVLGDQVPDHLAAIATLRLQHPHAGMGTLGKLATPQGHQHRHRLQGDSAGSDRRPPWFIARRRALRPGEEYRTPTDAEWDELLGQFERRKLALGDCGRAYGTSCQHEHSCVRCPVLRVDPAQRHRLAEIRDNLTVRIAEAKQAGWVGEADGLAVSLAAAEDKLSQIDARIARAGAVYLSLPSFPDIVARSAVIPIRPA